MMPFTEDNYKRFRESTRFSNEVFDETSLRISRYRWDFAERFLRESTLPRTDFAGIDVGDRTPMTERIGKVFSCKIWNTMCDLNEPDGWTLIDESEGKTAISDDIVNRLGFICAFEIVEHLLNPLIFVKKCREYLRAAKGRLFLSTPKGKPHFLWGPHHFHEMYKRELVDLLALGGFDIIRFRTQSDYPLHFYFTGIRPLLIRSVYAKKFLVEAAPK